MNFFRKRFAAAALSLGCALHVGPAGATGQLLVATTLLPKHGDGELWIIKGEPGQSDRHVEFQFALDSLPQGMQRGDLQNCTLRVTASKVGTPSGTGPSAGRVAVVVREPGAAENLALLGPKSFENRHDSAAATELCDAVWKRYRDHNPLRLELLTETRSGNLQLYPNRDAAPASFKPRLVLEYLRPTAGFWDSLAWHQHQHDPRHSGRSRWIARRPPTGFNLVKLPLPKIGGKQGTLAGYPLIWRGQVVVVQVLDNANWITALDSKGRELWSTRVAGGTLQTTPVIGPDAVLTLITETRLLAYQMTKQGATLLHERDIQGFDKLDANTGLTVGDDGAIYLTLRDSAGVVRVFGFTPKLELFLQGPPLEVRHAGTPGLDHAGRILSVGAGTQAVSIDLTDPAVMQRIALLDPAADPGDEFYPAIAGPEAGLFALADYQGTGAHAGNLWLVDAGQAARAAGREKVSIPVLGGDGRLRYLQDGELRSVDFSGNPPITLAPDFPEPLPEPKSNLVLDASDNLYYWDGGGLLGFGAQFQGLFKEIPFPGGPQESIRLTLDPWGSLWTANNNGSQLFVFHPQYTPMTLPIDSDLHHRTLYRASGQLIWKGSTLKSGDQALLQAGGGLVFRPGVRIEHGATLLVRTGY